jgi:hypothetical protein
MRMILYTVKTIAPLGTIVSSGAIIYVCMILWYNHSYIKIFSTHEIWSSHLFDAYLMVNGSFNSEILSIV